MGLRHQGHAETFPAHHQSKAKREKNKEKAVCRRRYVYLGGNTQGQEIAREPLRQALDTSSYDIADDKLSVRLVPM